MLPTYKQEVLIPSSSGAINTLESLLPLERARLVRLCARLTGNIDAAEDLAQETLLEAWKNFHKLQDHDDPSQQAKWLSAIARNVCMRWASRRGRDLSHLVSLDQDEDMSETRIESLTTDTYAIEIELERDELALLLDRALALLSPGTRDVLIARYLHESPHAEIAARLGLSEDALVQRLHRGKLALRRVITTHMSEEAEAYGMAVPAEERLQQETRIWCPMCGKGRLTKYDNPQEHSTGFFCPHCWHIAYTPLPAGNTLKSPRCILAHQLAWLGDYYWQAINTGRVTCGSCGSLAQAVICVPQDIPEEYRLAGALAYHSTYILCPCCSAEDINPLPHLTLDLSEARQFWHRHPRIQWLPGNDIEHEGQPALISSFQSLAEHTRLDVILQRDTLKVLSIHEDR
ncbi:MAG: RNA polymerase sigma factor [Chloroflexota bacterium]|nr:RNA polymerase sigma factor [Chloroflexota bacterium]